MWDELTFNNLILKIKLNSQLYQLSSIFMYKLTVKWKYIIMNSSDKIHISDVLTYFTIINKLNKKEKPEN